MYRWSWTWHLLWLATCAVQHMQFAALAHKNPQCCLHLPAIPHRRYLLRAQLNTASGRSLNAFLSCASLHPNRFGDSPGHPGKVTPACKLTSELPTGCCLHAAPARQHHPMQPGAHGSRFPAVLSVCHANLSCVYLQAASIPEDVIKHVFGDAVLYDVLPPCGPLLDLALVLARRLQGCSLRSLTVR